MQTRNFSNIYVTLKAYVAILLAFTTFRLILLVTNISHLEDTSLADMAVAMLMGLRFDTVIAGYILLPVYLLLTLGTLFRPIARAVSLVSFIVLSTILTVTFFASAVDIPYFNQFYSRLNIAALNWLESPGFVFKMVTQEPSYWLFIIPYLFITAATIIFIRRLLIRKLSILRPNNLILHFAVSVLFVPVIILGIRGRMAEKSPIRVGTAYFGSNPFLNQLGLNPLFTLGRSALDAADDSQHESFFMDDSTAMECVGEYLGINMPADECPLSRFVNADVSVPDRHRFNIVLVMMESMSAEKLSRHGNPHMLTPFLDSLLQHGYYFENAYSSGIHTYNGIFSTLFSYPTVYRQNPMSEGSMLQYHSIAGALAKHNYSRVFFTTHDGQFNNVEGFLMNNGFERVYTDADYPPEKNATILGVPDDYLFEYSIPVFNSLHQRGRPFFAAYITGSDHGPYYIPPYFKPSASNIKHAIVQYADWSLRRFMEQARQTAWFDSTLFVFVADHGCPLGRSYDLPIDYVHVPLLFYCPQLIPTGNVSSNMAGQIDIFPSIMGLLRLPFRNNTLGIDLFSQKRPYIFVNGNDKYGVLDQERFLVVRKDRPPSLYRYKNRDSTDYLSVEASHARAMKRYAEAHLQAFQYVTRKRLQY